MEKLNIRCEYFQSRFQESQVRNSLFSEELKSKNKNLHVEENKTSEQGKRLFVLNKLVKALKSKGNRQEDQNNYKMVINELVKEIEVFKRAITNKDKEIAHLREINEKMKAKIASFTKRIEILQMNLSQKKPEDEGIGSQDAEIENEAFSLLKEMRIPPMLDYRSSNLSALLTSP
jgi:chromosome segregation ATPase